MPSEEFRIGDYNYVFDSTVGLTLSSEEPAFPVDNLRDFQLSRVARTQIGAGTFVIDATNNGLDFSEGGGALNGTMTAGTYTAAELATEIVRVLTASGANTYTAAISDTTGRWTITSTGATFSLLWLTGSHTATSCGSTLGFDTTADSTGATSYTGAAIAIHTEESLVIDLRTTEDIDSFAMIFDKMLGNQFTPEAVLKLQGNATNYWTAPAVDVTMSFDEDYSLVTYLAAAVSTYRYWRLKIVDPRNPNLYVEIPKLWLTKATQLTQVPSLGWTLKSTDRSVEQNTQYGHRYSDNYPSLRTLEFSYPFMSAADLATLEAIFERVGTVSPVFLSLDGQASLFDKDRFFVYGYLNKDFKRTHAFYSNFNSGISFEEAL